MKAKTKTRGMFIFWLATGASLLLLSSHISAQAGIGSPPEEAMAQLPTSTRTPTPINVGNFVWDDLDGDGIQDAGEPGLSGITLQLWNSEKTQLIDSAVSSASGSYSLIAPTPGTYRVRAILPAFGDQFSPKDAPGSSDQTDSDINPTGSSSGFTDIYTFPSNLISITTIDVGIFRFLTPTPTRTPTPINIGNFIWHDLNGNGIQEGGEPGVGGVTVQLWNDGMTNLVSSATTNANGNYFLVAPIAGAYRVRVLPPAGSSFSPADQGSDTQDSDILPSPPAQYPGFTGVINIASNVISISSIDAGLINVQATATPQPDPLQDVYLPLIIED